MSAVAMASATGPRAASTADTIDRIGRALAHGLAAIGALLVFLPIVLTVYLSLFDETLLVFPPKGYTLSWFGQIAGKFGDAIVTSLVIAVTAVILSLLIGIPAGIGLSRYRFAGRGALNTLLLAPLTVPGVALGLGIYVFAVWVEENTGFQWTGSLILLIAAHVVITLPWVIRLCLASLTNHDRATEEAAASLGAPPLMVIWRVTLPAMRPGIAAGALFAFIASFENLEMTIFLVSPGTNTLPNAVLQYLTYRIDPLVAAVAVVQMAAIAIALVLLDRFARISQVMR
jgi:putative spermidine/putrescine transport system permease protein